MGGAELVFCRRQVRVVWFCSSAGATADSPNPLGRDPHTILTRTKEFRGTDWLTDLIGLVSGQHVEIPYVPLEALCIAPPVR
jgi:hypothetical protein